MTKRKNDFEFAKKHLGILSGLYGILTPDTWPISASSTLATAIWSKFLFSTLDTEPVLSNKIDVIILDLMLPDGSGLTLCRDIKSEPKTKNIPVIILTAKTEEVDRVVGFELGADDYVTKPFSVNIKS